MLSSSFAFLSNKEAKKRKITHKSIIFVIQHATLYTHINIVINKFKIKLVSVKYYECIKFYDFPIYSFCQEKKCDY